MAESESDLEHDAAAARARIAELEAALAAALEHAARAQRLSVLGTMVASVVHDINTPVGSIRANADLVERAFEKVDKALQTDAGKALLETEGKLGRTLGIVKESNATMKLAAERIIGLVRSLRTFSRDPGAKEELDVHETVDAALTLLSHQLRDGVEVEKRYGAIPRCKLCPGQMSQLFMNILVNGVQSIAGAGKITIASALDDGWIVLRFTDTGSGIATDVLPRIFDVGFTTKSSETGTGLGLAICRRICEEHGGTIECASEVGHGTTFTVRLPCACS